MSVGGYIIHIAEVRKKIDGEVKYMRSVWTCDRRGDECCVYVEPACPAQVGDQIWWQGRKVYWTPKDRLREDVPFARYGYSFDPNREATP